MTGPQLDRRRWNELCGRLGCTSGDDLFATLEAAYAERHRRYHTAQHVQECLDLLDRTREHAERADEVELAIWLHDVVYVPWRPDNERRSAEMAAAWMMRWGADPASVERVRRLVLATRHRDPPESPDEALLLDIDLGILGAPPDRFDEYETQVRAEHRMMPSPIFRARRRKLLSSILAREHIYRTPWFLEHREGAARRNLERALARLRS